MFSFDIKIPPVFILNILTSGFKLRSLPLECFTSQKKPGKNFYILHRTFPSKWGIIPATFLGPGFFSE
ncbi:hypothetical protein D0466_04460 [Peribacillus glennii]|uniref:Uncharacterized protein n=1 Tax=Peribacillus glennii TaxID=2303991 RepID=A0A372LHS8_9BACI|nr:hypothetical protein D0466_04460 [Peribacillus glennii]